MNIEQFRAICDLTVKLSELMQAGCAGLKIENFSPKLLKQLCGVVQAEIDGQVLPALKAASLALSASHNLAVSDRPDLPRDQWPVYVLDHRDELDMIDLALVALGKKSTLEPPTDTVVVEGSFGG